jgi:hypothetical protein
VHIRSKNLLEKQKYRFAEATMPARKANAIVALPNHNQILRGSQLLISDSSIATARKTRNLRQDRSLDHLLHWRAPNSFVQILSGNSNLTLHNTPCGLKFEEERIATRENPDMKGEFTVATRSGRAPAHEARASDSVAE